MADNSTLPVDSGTEVFANDDIGGVKYPRVKVTQGADGSSTDVSSAAPLYARLSDGTNPVAVKAASTAPLATDPALVVAVSPNSVNANGQNTAANSAPVVLSDYGKTKIVSVSLTPTTDALSAGDVVADSQQVDAALRVADGTGILQSIVLIDQLDQKAACTMYLLSANVAMGTENSAPSITDADATNILGFVDIGTGDYKDLGGVSVANIRSIGMPLVAASGTDDVYIAMVNGAGTPTYNSTGLIVRLGIQQD